MHFLRPSEESPWLLPTIPTRCPAERGAEIPFLKHATRRSLSQQWYVTFSRATVPIRKRLAGHFSQPRISGFVTI